jgi:hypothetical protein
LDDWIYCILYIYTVRGYRQYSAIAILHSLQFTVTHALGFSVFTSRILATYLSQSRRNFNSHVKSSWHGLIPFLPFLLSHLRLPSPELDPILILAAWGHRYIASRRTDRKHRFLCCKGMSTASFHSNGSYSIVACIFVVAGMCLPSRCLAMDIHVTVLWCMSGVELLLPNSIKVVMVTYWNRPNRSY